MNVKRPTIREEIVEMRVKQEIRQETVDRERKETRREISKLTSDVNTMRTDQSVIRANVSNLDRNMSDLKTDVKDGFLSLSSNIDGHFNHRSNRHYSINKKGAIGIGGGLSLSGMGYGFYELGKLLGLWTGVT